MFDRPENEVIIREPFYVIETAIVNVMGTYGRFLLFQCTFY